MPMTHIPEIGVENPYQKTGIINRHENTSLSYSLPKTGTRNIRYRIASQTRQKRARFRFSGAGFRRRFPAHMSSALIDTPIISEVSSSPPTSKIRTDTSRSGEAASYHCSVRSMRSSDWPAITHQPPNQLLDQNVSVSYQVHPSLRLIPIPLLHATDRQMRSL